MKALWYLWSQKLKNKIRLSLKKPGTYLYYAIILFYVGMTAWYLQNKSGVGAKEFGAFLIIVAILMIPGNLVSYAKRKGLLFRNSDVHFIFASPLHPKMVITYMFLQTLLMRFLICVVMVLIGIFSCKLGVSRMLAYGLFSIGFQFSYEGLLSIILFGSEKLTDKSRKWIVAASYCVYILIAFILLGNYIQHRSFDLELIFNTINGEALQMIPILGWYASVLHLLFGGATTVSVIGAVLYLVSFLLLVICAIRMKCTGAYYEDALTFADDYEEVLNSKKKGNTVITIGKKTKYKEAKVVWKGTGAKALFYRQLLEYKKSKLFIFETKMLLNLLLSIAISVLYALNHDEFGNKTPWVIPIAGAYLIFVFAAINGKWTKEINSPYTYLIPDNNFRKLMNVTMIPVIKNIISGMLLTLPAAVVMGLSPVVGVEIIIAYTLFASSKIYAHVSIEFLLGGYIGQFGLQMMEMFIIVAELLLAALGCFLGTVLGGIEVAYLMAIIILLLINAILITIATLNFYCMEKN